MIKFGCTSHEHKNSDILKAISEKNLNLKTVGFAAETENLVTNAKRKLSDKNLDLIVANDVSDESIGFDSDENEVTLITKKEKKMETYQILPIFC